MKKEFKVRVDKDDTCYGSTCLDIPNSEETQKYIKTKETKQNYVGNISADIRGRVFQ